MASIYQTFLNKYVKVIFKKGCGLIGKLIEETNEKIVLKPSVEAFTTEEFNTLGAVEATKRVEFNLKSNVETIVNKSKIVYLKDVSNFMDYEEVERHIKEKNK